jgi:hypothetical protein
MAMMRRPSGSRRMPVMNHASRNSACSSSKPMMAPTAGLFAIAW